MSFPITVHIDDDFMRDTRWIRVIAHYHDPTTHQDSRWALYRVDEDSPWSWARVYPGAEAPITSALAGVKSHDLLELSREFTRLRIAVAITGDPITDGAP